jgi:hypothetical protein
MTDQVTERDLENLEESADDHVQIAETVLGWADSAQLSPPLTVGRLLIVAAEHLRLAGRLDDALATAQQARPGTFDAHPTLVGIHLDRGEADAAAALADEVRTAGPTVELAQQLAEAFELGSELPAAERWYAIALRDADEQARPDILLGRYRVRRDAGKPMDVLDAETEQLAARLGRRPA